MDDGAKTPLSMPYSWPQRIAAIAIAIVSDIVNAIFTWAPPIVIGIDVVTAVLLWVVLGRPMVLLPVFIAEALPGVGIVPFWTLVAGGLAFFGRIPGRGRMDGAPPLPPQEQPGPASVPRRDPPR
jgi:hypothetical protein